SQLGGDLWRDALDIAFDKVIVVGALRDLREVASPGAVIVVGDLDHQLQHPSTDGRTIALDVMRETGVAQRNPGNRLGTHPRQQQRSRYPELVPYQNAALPSKAVELVQAASRDRLAIDLFRGGLLSNPGGVIRRHLRPLRQTRGDRPVERACLGDEQQTGAFHAAMKPPCAGLSLSTCYASACWGGSSSGCPGGGRSLPRAPGRARCRAPRPS